MKRNALFIGVLLALSSVASASLYTINVTAPTLSIANNTPSPSFTIPVTITGTAAPVGGFEIDVVLAPRSGATGVSFAGAVQPANFLFTQSHDTFAVSANRPNGHAATAEIFVINNLIGDGSTESISNTTRNLITVNLAITPGTTGVFDLLINQGGWTDVDDGNLIPLSNQTVTNGVLTVTAVPEPATLCLLALGGLGLLRRRHSRCG